MDMPSPGSLVNRESTGDAQAPPHNIEAEQGVIGALLLSNEVWDRLPAVAPDHFYDPLHGALFETIGKLIGAGKRADPVTLRTFFERHAPISDMMTVPQYIGRLGTLAPTLAYAVDYAKLVIELATKRRLIEVGLNMAQLAAESEADASMIVADAERALLTVSDARGGDSQVTFKTAVNSVLEQTNEAYTMGGRPKGLSTGLLDLDRKLGGLVPGNLVIIAGRPSMGKTALVTNIAWHLADLHRRTGGKEGCVVQFESGEMQADELAERIVATVSGVNSEKIRTGIMSEAEIRSVVETGLAIQETPLNIDEGGGLTLAKITARARRMKRQTGFGLLVIDYLQLIMGSGNANSNRVQDVTEITVGLKALAKELKVPVVALSQLSRKVEERADKRPQLADLRESGSIEQDADVVMFVFREEYYVERERPNEDDYTAYSDWQRKLNGVTGKAEIIIGKARHGRVGIVPVAWSGERTQFSNLAISERAMA